MSDLMCEVSREGRRVAIDLRARRDRRGVRIILETGGTSALLSMLSRQLGGSALVIPPTCVLHGSIEFTGAPAASPAPTKEHR